MSPNPEQFSIPEQPNQLPTAGENPNEAGHLGELPYDADAIGKRYNDESTVDTSQLEQVLVNPSVLPDGRTPAEELPQETPQDLPLNAPEHRSKKGLIAIGGVLGASALVAIGAFLDQNGGKGDNKVNLPPESVPTSAAPVVSGQTEPTTPETNKASIPLPVEEWKFYSDDGSSRSQEDVISDAKIAPDDHERLQDQYEAIFGRIESAINYRPDEKTVRTALNIPTEPLTRENYETVIFAYQKTVFDTIISGGGELRTMVDQLGKDTAFENLVTWSAGEDPYQIKISQDIAMTQKLTISNNKPLPAAGVKKPRGIGTFRYTSPTTSHDITTPQVPLNEDPATYEPTLQIAGSVKLIEMK